MPLLYATYTSRKNRDIKNGEKYITLEISSKLDCLYKKELISSESKDYIGIPDKGLTRYLAIRIKMTNKKKGNVFHY